MFTLNETCPAPAQSFPTNLKSYVTEGKKN